ncbi:Glucosaminyl phosphatidylinositol (GlcN-PI) nositol acylation protein, partial [Blyttiomyces sp. JEL0837]
ASYAAWRAIAIHLPVQKTHFSPLHLAIEYITLIIPSLIAVTFTQYTETVLTALCSIFIIGLMIPISSSKSFKTKEPVKSHLTEKDLDHRPFSVAFRACLQLVTIAAILGVDFAVFPRKFAKTETFGTSLMDLGVGGFVFSNGFVAGPRLKKMESWKDGWRNVIKSLRISLPLLAIGIVRTVLTKSVNYQEHVTEYGVHWNFFFTLGLIPIFTALLQLFAPFLNFVALGGMIIFVYQAALDRGLQDYIINAPREGGFIQLNREGVFSFFGYWAIFLVAAHLGTRILSVPSKPPSTADEKEKDDPNKAESFGALTGFMELLTSLSVLAMLFIFTRHQLGITVSRRMANVSYVLWVTSVTVSFLLGTIFVDLCMHYRYGTSLPDAKLKAIPCIFASINKNQLAAFLLANVFTGLVNLSIDTLSVSHHVAFGILAVYLAAVCFIAVVWRTLGWTLNLNGSSAASAKTTKDTAGTKKRK